MSPKFIKEKPASRRRAPRAIATPKADAKPSCGCQSVRVPEIPPTPKVSAPAPLSGQALADKIREQAYLLAEKDGFRKESTAYWVAAENAVKSGTAI